MKQLVSKIAKITLIGTCSYFQTVTYQLWSPYWTNEMLWTAKKPMSFPPVLKHKMHSTRNVALLS